MIPIKSSIRVKIGLILTILRSIRLLWIRLNHELEKLARQRSIDASILERSTPEKTLQMVAQLLKNTGVDASIIVAPNFKR
jgi:hypothetical protein